MLSKAITTVTSSSLIPDPGIVTIPFGSETGTFTVRRAMGSRRNI